MEAEAEPAAVRCSGRGAACGSDSDSQSVNRHVKVLVSRLKTQTHTLTGDNGAGTDVKNTCRATCSEKHITYV